LSNLNFEIIILSFTKASCNPKGNKIIFKDFLRGLEIGYELFNQKISIKMTPLTSRGCNFLASPFLSIFSAIDVQGGGLYVLFGYHKQWDSPEKNGEKPYLKCTMTDLSTLYAILIYLLGLPIKWTSIGRVDYRALREREREKSTCKQT
jgi:hypothetical protein